MVTEFPKGLATSHWARVEFASMIGRDVRMGYLDAPTAAAISAKFESKLNETFVLFSPLIEDFGLARRYLGNVGLGLRAADALHLAIAANRDAERILTLDQGMLRAGAVLGLPVETGIADV